jgi:hypothetical protein
MKAPLLAIYLLSSVLQGLVKAGTLYSNDFSFALSRFTQCNVEISI